MTQTAMLKTARKKAQDPELYLSYLYPHHHIQFITHSRYLTLELKAINNHNMKISEAFWRG